MKIGDRIFVRGYIDEIRKDTVIVRNDGGYFGTVLSEVTGELPSAQKTHEERMETHTCDLIDRQAAMEEISKQQTYKMFEGEDTLYLDANDVGSVLASLPSVQPERKKGKWIPNIEKSREYIGTVLINVEYDYWFCDTCGYRVEKGRPMYDFCPNCGADMREGE